MCCIRGFKGEWKIVSKDKALEYGKNRLKDLGLGVYDTPKENKIKMKVINKHVRGIDLEEFGIYE